MERGAPFLCYGGLRGSCWEAGPAKLEDNQNLQ